MKNHFRYVSEPPIQSVSLHLFTTSDGQRHGDVSGPMAVFANATFSDVVELIRCTSLDDAFDAGIRMANKNDTELVITGDADLWLPKWGELSRQDSPRLVIAKAG